MIRLVHVTTVPESLRFLRGQIRFMGERGYEVHLISSPGQRLHEFAAAEGAVAHPIELHRAITPIADLRSLGCLVTLLARLRPTIVHAHTPKGGLLGVLAARAARVPIALYHMRGLPFETSPPPRRWLLESTERISCGLADRVLCVGPSLREAALRYGITSPDRIEVLCAGGNGVDAEGRFDPERYREAGAALRRRLSIDADALVLGFVGRLVRDKGLVELGEAWRMLRERVPNLRLLLVGPLESSDPIPPALLEALRSDPRVIFLGEREDVELAYAAMDVFVLPSHREGLPNAPQEAAAMGLPVVASDLGGCRDVVASGVSGALVPVGASAALAEALEVYLRDEGLRRRHGAAGRARALEAFVPEDRWHATAALYARLVEGRR